MLFENYDLTSVVTPVDADKLEQLLSATGYNQKESKFLVSGFREGFDLGFTGSLDGLKQTAPNLKIRVGSHTILWNKIMKEVKLKRFAGPYECRPFENFIQSPVGLVPKDNGKDTRLIFHLSYPRVPRKDQGLSVNAQTPKHLCEVEYPDFSDAIRMCLKAGRSCKMGKSNFQSAFRNLGVLVDQFRILILKATCPFNGKTYFFVDKCLPFGHSISCNLFQRVSDGIAYIVRVKNNGNKPLNYLDDFFFAALLKKWCNEQM